MQKATYHFPHLHPLILKPPQFRCKFIMYLLLLLHTFMVRIFLKLAPFYLFLVASYDSDCYVSVPVFSYFSLILLIWEKAKHSSKSVSSQIRSQYETGVCEDSCSRLSISAKKNSHFNFENLLYTSSYLGTKRHIMLTGIKVLYTELTKYSGQ